MTDATTLRGRYGVLISVKAIGIMGRRTEIPTDGLTGGQMFAVGILRPLVMTVALAPRRLNKLRLPHLELGDPSSVGMAGLEPTISGRWRPAC